jgi:hypothetical protein
LSCGLLATGVKEQNSPLLEFSQVLYILCPVYPDTETKTMASKKGSKKKKAAKKKR